VVRLHVVFAERGDVGPVLFCVKHGLRPRCRYPGVVSHFHPFIFRRHWWVVWGLGVYWISCEDGSDMLLGGLFVLRLLKRVFGVYQLWECDAVNYCVYVEKVMR
jgi:hypothetical protein